MYRCDWNVNAAVHILFLRFENSRYKHLLASSSLSFWLHTSASLPFGGISWNFISGTSVRKNLSRKSNFGCKISDTKKVYIVMQQYAIFCRSKRVQSEPTLAFPWQHWTLLHSALAFRVMRTRHNVTLYVQCLTCYIVVHSRRMA